MLSVLLNKIFPSFTGNKICKIKLFVFCFVLGDLVFCLFCLFCFVFVFCWVFCLFFKYNSKHDFIFLQISAYSTNVYKVLLQKLFTVIILLSGCFFQSIWLFNNNIIYPFQEEL